MRPSLPNTFFIAALLVADGQPLLAQEHTLPARAKKMSQRVTPRLRSMDDFTTLAVEHANLTHGAYRAAAPSTWIFLIGAYRTFYYVRRSVKKFAELSAPGDYAIALVCWDDERLENVKLNKYGWGSAQFNEANVRAAFGGAGTLAARLADDAAFFGGRLILCGNQIFNPTSMGALSNDLEDSFAVLRELDESNRSVQKSAESTSI